MLTAPPPGFGTSAVNQQSNQLLGRPAMPGVGTGSSINKPPVPTSNGIPPQIMQMVKLLSGGQIT